MQNPVSSTHRSPQQRWQDFRAQHLPQLSKRQQRFAILGGIVLTILIVVMILPFLLPLAGPAEVSPQQLQDENGAFVTLNNTSIYFQQHPAPGDAVILIHGQAGSTLSWQHTLPALQQAGYGAYAIDLPGYGLSEKGLQLDFSHPAAADIVLEFMDERNINAAYLVGHAYGANIATFVAQNAPERVQGLVLVAPTLLTWQPPHVPEGVLNTFFVERWLRVGVRLVGPAAVGEQLRSATKIDEVVDAALIEDYARLMRTADWEYTAIGVIRDSHHNQLPAALKTIAQPTLLIWGTEDGWAPPDAANGILDAIPQSRLELLERVGHLPMHEAVSQFNTILIKFLDNEA